MAIIAVKFFSHTKCGKTASAELLWAKLARFIYSIQLINSMKHEVYSCLKMIESLYNRTINAYNIRGWGASNDLRDEFIRIRKLLMKYLSEEQFHFIPDVDHHYMTYESGMKQLILEVSTACDVTLSYLQSLEMDLNKELMNEKDKLRQREKELESREKEIEFMQKLLKKSLDAIKQFPELQRSKIVEDIKKSHRQIEEHTRKE